MYYREKLSNGLTVVCETIPYVRSVSIGFWVVCGSRDERDKEQGISHLLEHMSFKGTKNRSTRQIAETVDAVGGHMNAFTTKEYTCYYLKILDHHLRLGLELLADIAINPLLAGEELEKEKNVILEEIKSYEDSPDEQVFDLLTQNILRGHPLGHSILGRPESVMNLKREDLLSYRGRFYTPDNSCLAVVGNVNFEEFLKNAEEFWAGFSGKVTREEALLKSLAGTYNQRSELKKKRTEQVHLCAGVPGFHRCHEERYTLLVLDGILGGSLSSRLFQELREERGLVYATGSQYMAFRDAGLFIIYAGTSLEYFPEVLEVIRRQLKELTERAVTAEELSRTKEQIKGNLWLSLENTTNRMSRLAKAELFFGRSITPEEVISRVEEVTVEDLLRVSRILFREELFSLSAIGPFKKKLTM